MTKKRSLRAATLAFAVVTLLGAAVGPAGAASIVGVYKGEGKTESKHSRLGLIKFKVTDEHRVTNVVLDDYVTRCDGKTYTVSKTEFVNNPKLKGDGLGEFGFTYTFYKGTSNEMRFRVRGELKHPSAPRAVGIVRVGGAGLDSPGDWCGPAKEWKAHKV